MDHEYDAQDDTMDVAKCTNQVEQEPPMKRQKLAESSLNQESELQHSARKKEASNCTQKRKRWSSYSDNQVDCDKENWNIQIYYAQLVRVQPIHVNAAGWLAGYLQEL